jgi:hypothetical protein
MPQGGSGGPQMFPHRQFTWQGPSSPSAPPVYPALPWNNPVIHPRSSASTPFVKPPGVPSRSPMSLPM